MRWSYLWATALILLVPPTSAAVPANDDHLALRGEAAALPGDWQRPGATSDGTAGSFNVVAPHGVECVTKCDRAPDDCLIACDGSIWCVLVCNVTRAFCVHNGCNGPLGP